MKKERLARLNKLQDEITIELNKQEIGQQREVLIHYESKKEKNIYYGRSAHFRLVRVHHPENIIGKEVTVKITNANKTALEGEFIATHR